MIVFENLIKAVQRMERGMKATIKAALMQPLIEGQIIDLNVLQMDQGTDSAGEAIEPPYRPLTISIKQMKGQPFNMVTLEDEGDFKHYITIEYRGNDMFIFSKDWKNKKLTDKYGWQIFGLNDKNLAYIRLECLPFIMDYVRLQIYLR